MSEYNTCFLCCSVCGERFPLFDVEILDEPLDGSVYPRVETLMATSDKYKNQKMFHQFITKHLHMDERLENDQGTAFYLEHTCMLDVYNDVSRSRAFYTLPDSEGWFDDDDRR